MNFFRNERLWLVLTNIWTGIFFALVLYDFFNMAQFSYLIAPLSAVYIGMLTLYVASKEFDRWYDRHHQRRPGELFVIVWTIMMLVFFSLSIYSKGTYIVHSEVVANYIAVMTAFILTQKSKQMHAERHTRK